MCIQNGGGVNILLELVVGGNKKAKGWKQRRKVAYLQSHSLLVHLGVWLFNVGISFTVLHTFFTLYLVWNFKVIH